MRREDMEPFDPEDKCENMADYLWRAVPMVVLFIILVLLNDCSWIYSKVM